MNIIPIIAKADTISKSELHKFKIKIMGELVSNGVQIYQFPTDDEAVAEINAVMNVSGRAGPRGWARGPGHTTLIISSTERWASHPSQGSCGHGIRGLVYWVCTKGPLDLSVWSPTLGGTVLREGARRCMAGPGGWESGRNQAYGLCQRVLLFLRRAPHTQAYPVLCSLKDAGSQPVTAEPCKRLQGPSESTGWGC